ncbi:MAG: glycosyltransferase family 2 protein [Actinobacteria bacterium]|nr:glycosyltransferase family 2 protein [Actinomycetota bacterium]
MLVVCFAFAAGAITGVLAARERRARKHDELRTDLDRRRERGEAPGAVRLSVVVPAYNEERIGHAVHRLREGLLKFSEEGGLEIVVVDDGSHDGTADLAEAAGADVVIRQPVNRGKGSAVRAGMLAARGRTIAFTDADLSYSPDQIGNLLQEVEDGWDVVVGSRRHTDAVELVREGRLREIGSRGINILTKFVLLGEHHDTQCGLKAFRSDVARLIFRHSHVDGFAFDVEVFHLVERYKLSLREVPVRVENQSRSTVHVARDAARLVRDLFRIRSWDLQGVYELDPSEQRLPEASRSDPAGESRRGAAQ